MMVAMVVRVWRSGLTGRLVVEVEGAHVTEAPTIVRPHGVYAINATPSADVMEAIEAKDIPVAIAAGISDAALDLLGRLGLP